MVEPVAVEIRAELRQVKSMADFTYNLILNVPEDCLPQVQTLMAWLGDEVQLVIVSGNPARLAGGKQENDTRTRPKRKVRKGE